MYVLDSSTLLTKMLVVELKDQDGILVNLPTCRFNYYTIKPARGRHFVHPHPVQYVSASAGSTILIWPAVENFELIVFFT